MIYWTVIVVFTNESLALLVVLELITGLNDADGNVIVTYPWITCDIAVIKGRM